jgi:hypothetical protein
VDFKVELIRPRERRAVLLLAAALVTVVAASITYLHPAAPARASSPPILSAAAPAVDYQPAAYFVVPGTGRPTGGYLIIWKVASAGGSGGHRAG